MSISSNFPFDIKNNDEEDGEVLPFVKEYSNYVFPGQNINIIPDTVIPLDKVPDFKDFLQENFTQAPPQAKVVVQAPPQAKVVAQAPQQQAKVVAQAPQPPQQQAKVVAQAPPQQAPQQQANVVAQAPQQQAPKAPQQQPPQPPQQQAKVVAKAQQQQPPQAPQRQAPQAPQQQAPQITKIPLQTKPIEPKQKIEPTQKIETQPNMSILRLVNTFEQKQKELEEKQKELERKQIELEKKQKGSGEDNVPLTKTSLDGKVPLIFDGVQDNTLADTGTISNPVNILARERSDITTNPFIPNEQKIKEFEVIDKRANEIMQRAYDKNDIYNFSINEINKKISKSTVEFLDDLFVKPENENWIEYLQVILLKNERYVYFGFILIIFVIFMKFIE